MTYTDDMIAPAPWQLTGQGYLVAVYLPASFDESQHFVPPALAASRRGRFAYVIFADYQQSDVGAYHELLYIGGSLQFPQRRHLSISKIYVSSQASVSNGQRNWGIPKELAQFQVTYGTAKNNPDNIVLKTPMGEAIARLQFCHYGWPLPVNTRFVPVKLRTLGQLWQQQYFFFSPEAQGHIQPARVQAWQFDARYFPDLAKAKVVACFKVNDFNMIFPVPKTQAVEQ
ncbi:acetoacetate decarboxylase family protein [Agitococcus lubricus]|uniref:Acetoacetate decarboxylase n=1 Tax=Agitococcus lubricus TaxID=1077255 RepID=A0A2T5J2N3_9GAMM|nr:acetoacetate decarboxylase family protein [Agitococcus lubricus]PTQ90774.1 acetoacetate decarboxylase [Agitococcus lubricus]